MKQINWILGPPPREEGKDETWIVEIKNGLRHVGGEVCGYFGVIDCGPHASRIHYVDIIRHVLYEPTPEPLGQWRRFYYEHEDGRRGTGALSPSRTVNYPYKISWHNSFTQSYTPSQMDDHISHIDWIDDE